MNTKLEKIIKLTTVCYKHVEKTEVLTNLLTDNLTENKTAIVILELISQNITNIQNTIFEIQNSMPKHLS